VHLALLSAIAISTSGNAAPIDPHSALANQLAAETDTLAKSIATVDDKLHDADRVRLHRLHAAIRTLHARSPARSGRGCRCYSSKWWC